MHELGPGGSVGRMCWKGMWSHLTRLYLTHCYNSHPTINDCLACILVSSQQRVLRIPSNLQREVHSRVYVSVVTATAG